MALLYSRTTWMLNAESRHRLQVVGPPRGDSSYFVAYNMGFSVILQKRFSALLVTHCHHLMNLDAAAITYSGKSYWNSQESGFPHWVSCTVLDDWDIRWAAKERVPQRAKCQRRRLLLNAQLLLKQNQNLAQRNRFSVKFFNAWGSTPNHFRGICILQIPK